LPHCSFICSYVWRHPFRMNLTSPCESRGHPGRSP
jgi:hypothetical protein